MARIILNVELNNQKVPAGIKELRNQIASLGEAFGKIQNAKEVTDVVTALTAQYTALAKAANEVTKVAKKQADEQEALKNKYLDLEKQFADFIKTINKSGEKNKDYADGMASVKKQLEDTWAALRAYNKAETAEIDTVEELVSQLKEAKKESASLGMEYDSLTKAMKEGAEAQKAIDGEQAAKMAHDRAEDERLRVESLNEAERIRREAAQAELEDAERIARRREEEERLRLEAIDERTRRERESSEQIARQREEEERLREEAVRHANEVEQQRLELEQRINEEYNRRTQLIERTIGNAAIRLWRTWYSEVRSILGDVNEVLEKTEQTVIEIQRVLNDTVNDRDISNALYGLAQQYGQTFENASTIAQNFAKSGMSWNETIKATESALLAMNVAELNASESSEGLLSIMVQFKKEASELETVVDELNKTADKNPVTTEKLLKALQRTGSAAATSNLTLEKTIGIITALSAATNRSGQNIGTATNALIMYTQKHLDLFASMSEESAKVVDNFKKGSADLVDIWKQAQEEITRLKNQKGDITSLLDLFGNDEDMEELNSTLHDELEDTFEQINSVYGIANTYRKNYFIALLDNLDRLDKVQTQLQDSQGYSQKENLKYMETYEAKVNSLTAKWEYLANDEQGLLKFRKWLVEIGNGLLDVVGATGGLVNLTISLTGIIGGLILTIKSAKIAKWIGEATEAVKSLIWALQGAEGAAEGLNASLGWVGLIVAALSLVVGAFNAISSSVSHARQAMIDEANAAKDDTKELGKLYSELQKLDDKSDEYYKVEDKIVKLLGDKADALKGLKKKTEEYSDAVKQLTKDDLEHQAITQYSALNAAKGELTKKVAFAQFSASQYILAGREATGRLEWGWTADDAVIAWDAFIKKMDEVEDKAKEVGKQFGYTSKEYADAISEYEKYYASYQDIYPYIEALNSLNSTYQETINLIHSYDGSHGGHTGSFMVTPKEQSAGKKLAGQLVYNATDLLNKATGTTSSDAKSFGYTPPEEGVVTGSTTDEYLESLKEIVALRKSELTLMGYQGATLDEKIAKNKEIQDALHVQAEYMRSAGYSQSEINALSSEWYSIQENITKLIKSQYTDEINLIKSRLTLMEHQEVSADKQIEQMKKIQSSLHEEAEYLREIKATEEEINAVSSEWWTWQEKILKLYQETLDKAKEIELDAIEKIISSIQEEIDLEEDQITLAEKRLAITNAQADLEKAIAQAKIEYVSQVLSDYLSALSDAETLEQKQKAVVEAREKYATAQKEAQTKAVVEAMKAQKNLGSDALSLEEKRLAVEEARQALINAQNDRTTRVFDEATGEWHYEANAQNVKSAQEKLADAMESLDKYLEGEAWDEILEKMEKGSLSEGELLSIIQKWQSQGYGTTEWGTAIVDAYRMAIGTKADPDSVAGELEAVNKAVDNLNSYLKNQAIKEIQNYIKDGNYSTAGVHAIMEKWLSLGEGGEIRTWSQGVLNEVDAAIQSGKYDDKDVRPSIDAVTAAINNLKTYLQDQFITQVNNLVANGTSAELLTLIEAAVASGELDASVLEWARRLLGQKQNLENVTDYYNKALENPNPDNYNRAAAVVGGNGNAVIVTNGLGLDSTTKGLVDELLGSVTNKVDSSGKQSYGYSTGASDKTPSVVPVKTVNNSPVHSNNLIVNGMAITPQGDPMNMTLGQIVNTLGITKNSN